MPDILEIVIRAFLTFFLLMTITHFIGKQIIAQMTTYQFVAAMTLGSIAGNMVFNIKIRMLDFVVALVLFAAIVFGSSYLDLKTKRYRKYLSGEPTVLIDNGNILEQNMGHLKITLDSLKQALRGKGIFHIEEVNYALIEPNGMLSVQKKPEFLPLTRKDLALTSTNMLKPVEIILEGRVLERNLENNQLTKEWLMVELKKRGIMVSQVFYGVKGSNGLLYFDLYSDKIKPLQ